MNKTDEMRALSLARMDVCRSLLSGMGYSDHDARKYMARLKMRFELQGRWSGTTLEADNKQIQEMMLDIKRIEDDPQIRVNVAMNQRAPAPVVNEGGAGMVWDRDK